MKQGSFVVPREKIDTLMKGSAMNKMEGIVLLGIADPKVKDLIPPPLELTDPENPVFYVHIVNIKEPTFSPWYMEGVIGIMTKFQDKVGCYFLNLQLSGPGAMMGTMIGRETSGLPKKLCERIVVERDGDYGHCFIERKGVRLIDVELDINGKYNDPNFHRPQEACLTQNEPVMTYGACMLHTYHLSWEGFSDLELVYYDSPTRYYSWEPANATVKLQSSLDDPWGEIPIKRILGAGWCVQDNWARAVTPLYKYGEQEGKEAMRYLITGRYDRCMLSKNHQHYE